MFSFNYISDLKQKLMKKEIKQIIEEKIKSFLDEGQKDFFSQTGRTYICLAFPSDSNQNIEELLDIKEDNDNFIFFHIRHRNEVISSLEEMLNNLRKEGKEIKKRDDKSFWRKLFLEKRVYYTIQ